MIKTLKETIMKRDNLSKKEAEQMIEEARERIEDGEDPEEILYEEFGLEPDYIFDLI